MKAQVTTNELRDILICFDYEQGMTLAEVGTRHNLTRERVRQILNQHDIARRKPGELVEIKYNDFVSTHGDAVITQMRATGSVRQAIDDMSGTFPKAWLVRISRERINKGERLQQRRGPNYSDAELIQCLVDKAIDGKLSSGQYEKMRNRSSEPALATYILRFGSWSKAMKAAGLYVATTHEMYVRRWSDEEMLTTVRSYAIQCDAEGVLPTVIGYSEWREQHPGLPSFSTMRFQTGQNWLSLLASAYEHDGTEKF
jgi:hypothetical protein